MLWLQASGCFRRNKVPRTHNRSLATTPNGPSLEWQDKEWDAILQGESDFAELSEIHPCPQSIGVSNGKVCEQATDYFAKSKGTVSVEKVEPQKWKGVQGRKIGVEVWSADDMLDRVPVLILIGDQSLDPRRSQ